MEELARARSHVADEITTLISYCVPEHDSVQLEKAKRWLEDALKEYELAILKAAGVAIREYGE